MTLHGVGCIPVFELCVSLILSVVFLELSRYVGLPGYITSAVERLLAVVWCSMGEEMTRLKARPTSKVKESLKEEGRGYYI